MVVVRIRKTLVYKALAFLLVLSLGWVAYDLFSPYNPMSPANPFKAPSNQSNAADPSSPVLSLAAWATAVNDPVEIFDIVEGKVIKTLPTDAFIRQQALAYLDGITGVYVKVNAFPKKGIIFKVPLDPPVHVKNAWMDENVNNLFILFPAEGSPYLLILDERQRPFFYNFEGNTNVLLEKAGQF